MIALIFAQAENGVIGRDRDLPWHLPADLKHFKRITTGNTIVMGRRTFESIGRALPDRRSIVLTRDPSFTAADVEIASSWEDASEMWADDSTVFVIGGADLFRTALPHATYIYRTVVHADIDGDVVLPKLSNADWKLVRSEHHEPDDRNRHPYTFQELQRITR